MYFDRNQILNTLYVKKKKNREKRKFKINTINIQYVYTI